MTIETMLHRQTQLQPETARGRVQSIDLLRGLIMVIMAIDHVRVYSGIPAGGTSYDIFFTRWITNFCAPGFVFFAGCSAFLYGIKSPDKKKLAGYLFTRGIFLVLLELTLVRFFWTFNFNYGEFTLAGIIWMIGWCMVILAALVRLKPLTVGIVGVCIIFFQQLFQYFPGIFPASFQSSIGSFWEFIYPAGLKGFSGIAILYVIVPWIGVMAAGYGFGKVFLMKEVNRNKLCWWLGLSATLIFIIFAVVLAARQQSTPKKLPFLLQVLNQKKYPASQLFLLMTLGPLIALIPLAEKAKGWISKVLVTFGKVPLFYYVCHILAIHTGALIINYFRTGSMTNGPFAYAPFVEIPAGEQWSIGLLYAEFAVVVFLLYFLCRWYAKYKSRHPAVKWIKYL
jgi:uncharacterized membrane protein